MLCTLISISRLNAQVADAVAKLAVERLQQEKAVEALHLCEVTLATEPNHQVALQTKVKALEWLRAHCKNSNERGWLDFSISQVKRKLSTNLYSLTVLFSENGTISLYLCECRNSDSH